MNFIMYEFSLDNKWLKQSHCKVHRKFLTVAKTVISLATKRKEAWETVDSKMFTLWQLKTFHCSEVIGTYTTSDVKM